jgi:hypothetical protein
MTSIAICFLLSLAQTSPAPQTEPDGPPVIRRGKNPPRKTAAEPKAPTIITAPQPRAEEAKAPDSPAAEVQPKRPVIDISASIPRKAPTDALIARAMETTDNYDATLPNFFCDQFVNRFNSNAKPPKWKRQDRIELELMYSNRREQYRNIRVNGKPLKVGSLEDSGSWSKGDWGAVLASLMNPSTRAVFKIKGDDVIGGVKATAYDYTVEQRNSQWRIQFGTEIKPAYKGTIWIEPETARVMRVELQARQLPNDYQLDTIETITEYGWVLIAGQKHLMPVKSEVLACYRYTDKCTRNDIEYKNYRRFVVESTISTTESEISFDTPPPPETPKAPPAAKKKD